MNRSLPLTNLLKMKIAEVYSHLNGREHVLVHKPGIWTEIEDVITSVDAPQCKTKVSKEKTMMGRLLYNPGALNIWFKKECRKRMARVEDCILSNSGLQVDPPRH